MAASARRSCGVSRATAPALSIAGRDAVKANALATKLRDEGLAASGCAMDARSVDSIRAAVDGAVAEFGAVDILMNCVGIQREQPLQEVTEEAWDDVVDVNLKAAMFTAQAVARHQVAAGRGGRQVHLLSVRAQLGLRDRGYSAYCSTKGGLAMLVRQHAMELARHRITVNGIAPTVVRTEMARHWFADPVTAEAIVDRIPLGRAAEPATSSARRSSSARRHRTSSPARFSTWTAASRPASSGAAKRRQRPLPPHRAPGTRS